MRSTVWDILVYSVSTPTSIGRDIKMKTMAMMMTMMMIDNGGKRGGGRKR